MIKYKPKILEKKLLSAINYFEKDLELSEIVESLEDIEDFQNYASSDEIIITNNSIINIGLPRQSEVTEITCSKFINLADEMKSAKLLDNLICTTDKRYIVRVEGLDYDTIMKLYHQLDSKNDDGVERGFLIKSNIDNKTYNISIVNGITPFGILIAFNGDYEKYFPPVMEDEYFIEVSCSSSIDNKIAEALIEAYIFELSISSEINLKKSPRPHISDVEEDFEKFSEFNFIHRPLNISKGMAEIHTLYNHASSALDNEISLLFYNKIIEYVAQTVIRMNKTEAFLVKLSSKRALSPDANFIIELENTFEGLRRFKKDKESIITTILKCCDVDELYSFSPIFILNKFPQKDDINKNEKIRNDFLKYLATVIVDTRNAIVHAKANYEPTGNECPGEELPEFVNLVRIASVQIIRWYGNLHENSRVS